MEDLFLGKRELSNQVFRHPIFPSTVDAVIRILSILWLQLNEKKMIMKRMIKTYFGCVEYTEEGIGRQQKSAPRYGSILLIRSRSPRYHWSSLYPKQETVNILPEPSPAIELRKRKV